MPCKPACKQRRTAHTYIRAYNSQKDAYKVSIGNAILINTHAVSIVKLTYIIFAISIYHTIITNG